MGLAQRFPASFLGAARFAIAIATIAVTTDHHLAVATGAMVKAGVSFHRHPGRWEQRFEWIYTEESETLTLSRTSAVLGIASVLTLTSLYWRYAAPLRQPPSYRIFLSLSADNLSRLWICGNLRPGSKPLTGRGQRLASSPLTTACQPLAIPFSTSSTGSISSKSVITIKNIGGVSALA